MPKLKPEEIWALECLSEALPAGTVVKQHDDGTENSMYDLDVIYPDGRTAAVEVTTNIHRAALEFMKAVGKDGPWIEPGLDGCWVVRVQPTYSVKQLRETLPDLLRMYQAMGLEGIDATRWWEPQAGDHVARALGITTAKHMPTDGRNLGRILAEPGYDMDKMGGVVPDVGDGLPAWFGEWLVSADNNDNRAKLEASGKDEHHLFLIAAGFGNLPFGVQDMLMRNETPLPTIPLELPPEITHGWLLGTWGEGQGYAWSADAGWSLFNKMTPSIRMRSGSGSENEPTGS